MQVGDYVQLESGGYLGEVVAVRGRMSLVALTGYERREWIWHADLVTLTDDQYDALVRATRPTEGGRDATE